MFLFSANASPISSIMSDDSFTIFRSHFFEKSRTKCSRDGRDTHTQECRVYTNWFKSDANGVNVNEITRNEIPSVRPFQWQQKCVNIAFYLNSGKEREHWRENIMKILARHASRFE